MREHIILVFIAVVSIGVVTIEPVWAEILVGMKEFRKRKLLKKATQAKASPFEWNKISFDARLDSLDHLTNKRADKKDRKNSNMRNNIAQPQATSNYIVLYQVLCSIVVSREMY